MKQIHSSPARAKAGTIIDAGIGVAKGSSHLRKRAELSFVKLRLIGCEACSIDSRRTGMVCWRFLARRSEAMARYFLSAECF